jgi:hypothetical protein
MYATTSRMLIALAALLAVVVPGQAQACGGFFCNQPQSPGDLPVAQTAENVLFAMSRTPSGAFQLEAHVQIAYTGPADRFSWVVPVDTKPELDVGSDAVFTQLLQLTEPRFNVEWKEEGKCRNLPMTNGRPLPPPQSSGGGGRTGSGDNAGPGGTPGVDVSFQGAVGPYDAAVIKSTDTTDSKPLLDWLAENKYFVSAEGSKLIADYVREDKFFVAIRLMSGLGVNQIQPLVMRFLGPGPCIPLRLTAIAALADLQINLWVLGEQRVVPDNFYEIQLNEAAISWLPGIGRSYDEVVKRAANEAGGNAFVTDYAGPASILRGQIFQEGSFSTKGIAAALTPPDALDAIAQTGLPRDNRLMELLRMFIPEPALLKEMGIDERTFYNQLRFYWTMYREQFAPFDAGMLAAAVDTRLVAPLRKAQALVDGFPTLTRLRTFISPEEMSQDPTFVMNSVLPPVPAARQAKAFLVCGQEDFTRCDAPVRLELPGGSVLWLEPQPQKECFYWAQQADAYKGGDVVMSLPSLQIGWKRDDATAGVERFNNQVAIQQALSRHNEQVQAYARSGSCGCHLGGAGRAGGIGWMIGAVFALALGRRLSARRTRTR